MDAEKVTAPGLARRKSRGEVVTDKIVMVTAYDATFAALADDAGVDVVLVGDSLGMVVQGVANTLPVTLDEAVYHTRLAARRRHRLEQPLRDAARLFRLSYLVTAWTARPEDEHRLLGRVRPAGLRGADRFLRHSSRLLEQPPQAPVGIHHDQRADTRS